MWDYGYLWQIAVFSEAYPAAMVENAFRYLPRDCMSSALRLEQGRLYADVMPAALPEERDAVTFFGPKLPPRESGGDSSILSATVEQPTGC